MFALSLGLPVAGFSSTLPDPAREETSPFQILRTPSPQGGGFDEVGHIKQGLKRICAFVREKEVEAIVFPGRSAGPLEPAVRILLPEAATLHMESLSRLSLNKEHLVDSLLAQNARLAEILNRHKEKVLFLDDGLKKGNTLAMIKRSVNRVYGTEIMTGALFVTASGFEIQRDAQPDVFGAMVACVAPNWYLIHQNPEAYSWEDKCPLAQASVEMALLAREVAREMQE